ncbi:MAG: hypothetical protein ABI618_12240, partial [Nitrospirota bacterium]
HQQLNTFYGFAKAASCMLPCALHRDHWRRFAKKALSAIAPINNIFIICSLPPNQSLIEP